MVVQVDSNGLGKKDKETHVSVFASVLGGVNDAELKWPFIGEVKITLLNQLEDKNHHTDSILFTLAQRAPMGKLEFIHHSALAHNPAKNTQYLKDDSLYFRVSVEAENHKSWLQCIVIIFT